MEDARNCDINVAPASRNLQYLYCVW